MLFSKISVLKSSQRLKKCGFLVFLEIELADYNAVLIRYKRKEWSLRMHLIFCLSLFLSHFSFHFLFLPAFSPAFSCPPSSFSHSLSPFLLTLLLSLSSNFSFSLSLCLKLWRSFDQVWSWQWLSKQNWKYLLIHLSFIFGRSLNSIQNCTRTILHSIMDTLPWQWLKMWIPSIGHDQFLSSSYCAAYM